MSDLELELNTPEDETVPTIMLIDEDGNEEAHQVLGDGFSRYSKDAL